MNTKQVLKKIELAKVKHTKEERQSELRAKKEGYDFHPYTFSLGLKYYTRLEVFKGSNVEFNFKTMRAYSYGWWRFVDLIKGKVVFNDYRYSNSTTNHQYAVKKVLRQLGIKIDHKVHINEGLQELSSCLKRYYTDLFDYEIAISRGREKTWAQDNRYSQVKRITNEIKIVRSLGAKLSRSEIKKIKNNIYNDETARLKELVDRKKFVKTAITNKNLFNLNESVVQQ